MARKNFVMFFYHFLSLFLDTLCVCVCVVYGEVKEIQSYYFGTIFFLWYTACVWVIKRERERDQNRNQNSIENKVKQSKENTTNKNKNRLRKAEVADFHFVSWLVGCFHQPTNQPPPPPLYGFYFLKKKFWFK